MKRSTSVLLLALFLASALAQPTPPALLWTVSGNELAAPGYLYGTVHSKDERAYTYSMHVMGAMAGMHSVAGELDFTEVGKSSMALMNMMMMPDGQRLEDLYSKKQWKEVEAALRKRLSIMAGMVMRMKPFFVMAMLSESSMGTDRPEVLDAYLMEHGRQLDKRVFGLETMKEQVAAVDALPVKEQAKALLAHLRSDGTAEMNELLDAYARQDLDILLRLMAESPSMPSGLQKSLIVDRNRVMAHRMDSVLRADGASMFMVGAGHLPGKEGVVELLRARGYTVAPVDMIPDEEHPGKLANANSLFRNDTLNFEVLLPPARMKLTQDFSAQGGGRMVSWLAEQEDGSAFQVHTLDLAESDLSITSDSLVQRMVARDGRRSLQLIGQREILTQQGSMLEVDLLHAKSGMESRMWVYRWERERAYVLMAGWRTMAGQRDAQSFLDSFRVIHE